MKYYAENKVHLGLESLPDTLCGIPTLVCLESLDKVSCEECKRILNELKKELK